MVADVNFQPDSGALLPDSPSKFVTISPKNRGKRPRVPSSPDPASKPPAKRQLTLNSRYEPLLVLSDEDDSVMTSSVPDSSQPTTKLKSKKSRPSKSKSKASTSALDIKSQSSAQAPQGLKSSAPPSSTSFTLVNNPRPVSKVLDSCPLSSKAEVCSKCKLLDDEKGLVFFCHCGHKPVKLPGGRPQNAKVHWRSGTVVLGFLSSKTPSSI